MAARYDLDNYNRVTARMDIGTSVGSLSWRNRAEDGDLRVRVCLGGRRERGERESRWPGLELSRWKGRVIGHRRSRCGAMLPSITPPAPWLCLSPGSPTPVANLAELGAPRAAWPRRSRPAPCWTRMA